jgi:hypothetical protein
MLAMSMLTWWYGQGWTEELGNLKSRPRKIVNLFSVDTLLRTLFSPWRRIISVPGSNIKDRLAAAFDNLISRAVGFVIRLFVLLAAIVVIILVIVASLIELIIWPLLPVSVIVLVIVGLLKL